MPSFYDIYAFANHYLPKSSWRYNDFSLETIEFSLERGGVEIHGTVVDDAGHPIKGAKVALLGSARVLDGTDIGGEFRLWGPRGHTKLVVWADGYADTIIGGDTTKPFQVTLSREAILVGKVIDKLTGSLLPGTWVTAGRQDAGINPTVYTDDGRFRIMGLPAGRYRPSIETNSGYYGKLDRPVVLDEFEISPELEIEARWFGIEKQLAPGQEEEAIPDDWDAAPEMVTNNGLKLVSPNSDESLSADDESDESDTTQASNELGVAAANIQQDSSNRHKKKRRELRNKLHRCGKDMKIEVKAAYILDKGELFKWKVSVDGPQSGIRATRRCVRSVLKRFRFHRDKEPKCFKTLRVHPTLKHPTLKHPTLKYPILANDTNTPSAPLASSNSTQPSISTPSRTNGGMHSTDDRPR